MERDIKKEVTERWLIAVDHLIELDVARSYRELANAIGIDPQRINIIKNFIQNDGRPSYVGSDFIYMLNKKYKVSYRYLLNGEDPILERDAVSIDLPKGITLANEITSESILSKLMDQEGQNKIFEKKIELLEHEINLIKRHLN